MTPNTPRQEAHPLDAMTGGVFSAATSGDRASRVRDWLATQPGADDMQEVYKELSARDKGAARLLREKLDELRRAKGQEAMAAEWAEKAQGLLAQSRLNIADALAWQRDAAKAGAPLSREPLAGLRTQLNDRVKAIEDLQHRVQVQREAAVLLAQRVEILSTKSWKDAQAVSEALATDVATWQSQADALAADAGWASLEARFPPLLDASRSQLLVVWEAFRGVLAQAVAAAADAAAPLPPVPFWADEIRADRGVPAEAAPKAPRPKVDPQVRERAVQVVGEALAKLEAEVAQGHGKASAGAANALRNALKEHGKLVGEKLEGQAHAALAAAGELEGWQRWRADQLREELVAKAEALVPRTQPTKRVKKAAPVAPAATVETASAEAASTTQDTAAVEAPLADAPAEAVIAPAAEQSVEVAAEPVAEAAPVADVQAAEPAAAESAAAEPAAADQSAVAPAAPAAPRLSGRKMQEALRNLREQWKQVDQGGVPNHALWKRFDEACNRAHKVVEVWLEKVRAESAEHRAQRLALIEEVKSWTATQGATLPAGADLKGINRTLHQFSERWREAGHLNEKAFAELQPLWKEAISAAHAPLEAAQKGSVDRRHAMIEEANALGAAPMLRIDAVRSLQQRWQAEAQSVPLDRRHEQRLWDAFRKPIDEAFNRKTAEREKASAEMSERDRAVLNASKALEAASAGGDAGKIRQAMADLEAALRAQAAPAAAQKPAAEAAPASAPASASIGEAPAAEGSEASAQPAEAGAESPDAAATEPAAPAAAPKAPPKPVVAVRGDDRPGMKKSEPAAPVRGGRFGDKGGRGGDRPGAPRTGGFGDRRPDDRSRGGPRDGRDFDRAPRDMDRGPRLGDAAFRAQRDAVERAQTALRKLASQAHGEALTQLLDAWSSRAADKLPSQSELGRAVTPAARTTWAQAVGQSPSGDGAEALLRLEMAAEVPTPAEQLQARRMMQLQLLTRRNDPSPAQTWTQDVAKVLSAPHDDARARRLQNALKALLR